LLAALLKVAPFGLVADQRERAFVIRQRLRQTLRTPQQIRARREVQVIAAT
jgi:hypothetical protein